MKKLFTLLLVLIACSVSAIDMGPYDTGAARKSDLGTMAAEAATDYVATDTFTGHTDATGASVHGLGTISTKADTDYVATSALALRLDTGNASFTGDIDVTGDVGAATVNGVAPLTAAEKTQALVGSSTVDFLARNASFTAITQNAWIEPSLEGAWVDASAATYNKFGYFKDKQGFVHIRGVVSGGAVPSTVFTLPAGSRPTYQIYTLGYASTGGVVPIAINTAGAIRPQTGTGTFYLDGIMFDPR